MCCQSNPFLSRQQQLSEQHHGQADLDKDTVKHIKFLETLPLYGLSNHNLLFTHTGDENELDQENSNGSADESDEDYADAVSMVDGKIVINPDYGLKLRGMRTNADQGCPNSTDAASRPEKEPEDAKLHTCPQFHEATTSSDTTNTNTNDTTDTNITGVTANTCSTILAEEAYRSSTPEIDSPGMHGLPTSTPAPWEATQSAPDGGLGCALGGAIPVIDPNALVGASPVAAVADLEESILEAEPQGNCAMTCDASADAAAEQETALEPSDVTHDESSLCTSEFGEMPTPGNELPPKFCIDSPALAALEGTPQSAHATPTTTTNMTPSLTNDGVPDSAIHATENLAQSDSDSDGSEVDTTTGGKEAADTAAPFTIDGTTFDSPTAFLMSPTVQNSIGTVHFPLLVGC